MVVLAAMSACAPSGPGGGDGPRAVAAQRSVNFGFEDITDPHTDWAAVDAQLEAAGVNAVSVAVGRPDWTAFDWPAHPDATSPDVADIEGDPVALALSHLREAPDGEARTITVTIDVFAPRMLADDPDLAGVDAHGNRSDLYASASALHEGAVGQRIDELVAHAATYGANRVALTELMFDEHTFGDDDLELFQQMTGAQDWPRTPDGDIDTASPEVHQWRSEVVGDVVARAAGHAHAGGADLAMDVRVDWDDPAAGRPDSGHDYGRLYEAADHVVLWAYPGLSQVDPARTGQLTRALLAEGWDPHSFTVSVGLWADSTAHASDPADGGDTSDTLSADQLLTAVDDAAAAGAQSVSVTPASMLDTGHWDVLEDAWGPR